MPERNDPSAGIVPPGQPSILIVDDEEGVLNALRRLLRREGYHIVCAGSAEEGLRVLQQQGRKGRQQRRQSEQQQEQQQQQQQVRPVRQSHRPR